MKIRHKVRWQELPSTRLLGKKFSSSKTFHWVRILGSLFDCHEKDNHFASLKNSRIPVSPKVRANCSYLFQVTGFVLRRNSLEYPSKLYLYPHKKRIICLLALAKFKKYRTIIYTALFGNEVVLLVISRELQAKTREVCDLETNHFLPSKSQLHKPLGLIATS